MKNRRNWKKNLFAAAVVAMVGVASAGVTCRVEPDYGVRLADKPGEAYVKVSLTADKVASKNRPQVNLAIVLDRSGSMHGDRIVKAREAACEAIRRLDARDIVSVVAYDDFAEVVIAAQPAVEKEAMIAKVKAIEARGSTALFAGVAAGAVELKKYRDKCEINRVLLLSDGQANVGPSSAEELGRYGALLMKDGVAVSTIGLGMGYNEDLMTRLAQKSDGNSYFVENNDALPRVFARELGDVLAVAATRVSLKVRFTAGFTPVQLVGRDGRIADGVASIDLNQLYGGQEKYVIVKCDAAPGKAGTKLTIAQAQVSYVDPRDGGERSVTAAGSVSFSNDLAAVNVSVNKGVVRERIRNENALRTEEAIRLADRGEFEKARALNMLNSSAAQDAQKIIGIDAELQEEATTQAVWSEQFNRRSFDSKARKGMKTKGFSTLNQQRIE